MMRSARILALMALGPIVLSMRVSAQTSPRFIPAWEIGTSSRYVWRGVTRHRGFAGHGQVGATRTGKFVDVSLTGWTSVVSDDCEPCRQVLGLTVAELNASFTTTWHPAFRPFRAVDVTTGISVYSASPAPWDLVDTRGTTTELLLSLSSRPSRHAQVSVTAWMDIDKVKGTYFEGSATIPFTLAQGSNPRMFLTGTLGVNGGQLERPGEPGYFAERGPAFGSLQLNYLPIWSTDPCNYRGSVQLWVRLQGNFDPMTKQHRVGEGQTREQRVWVGALWRGSMGRVVPPGLCRPQKPPKSIKS